MKAGKTLYVTDRKDWRAWLRRNHEKENEVWLVYYRKRSGKPRITYDDAVEEALSFGWIDSIQKGIDEERYAQRFSPRRTGSGLSEMNKERIRRLIKHKKMTPAGLEAVKGLMDYQKKRLVVAADILRELKKDEDVWRNYQRFPETYKRIRVGWIEGARNRPKLFEMRLRYFLKMTAKNKKFGMVQ